MSCAGFASLSEPRGGGENGDGKTFRFRNQSGVIRLKIEIIAEVFLVRVFTFEADVFSVGKEQACLICGQHKVAAFFDGTKAKRLTAFQRRFRGKIFVGKKNRNHKLSLQGANGFDGFFLCRVVDGQECGDERRDERHAHQHEDGQRPEHENGNTR